MKENVKISLVVMVGVLLAGIALYTMYLVFMNNNRLNAVVNFLNNVPAQSPEVTPNVIKH